MVKLLLAHPATRGIDLDSPQCTEIRKDIIKSNPYLQAVYHQWYHCHSDSLPDGDGKVLEVGSGAGFFKDFLPDENIITSDIIPVSEVDLTINAQELQKSFEPESLRGITMINVMHHLPNVTKFFEAANETLAPGGVISFIEPWPSTWSKIIYTRRHHEPFDLEREDWGFESTGPLSGANGAIPWIVFQRDRQKFEKLFPDFEIAIVNPIMPFLYLISGGVSMRQLQPTFLLKTWQSFEKLLRPLSSQLAMFAHIVVRKKIKA